MKKSYKSEESEAFANNNSISVISPDRPAPRISSYVTSVTDAIIPDTFKYYVTSNNIQREVEEHEFHVAGTIEGSSLDSGYQYKTKVRN